MVLEHTAAGRNHRYFSCYLGEDFIRLTKRLATRVHPCAVGVRVIEHYTLHACLKWAGLTAD